jgi:large subunit ribosomal protein L9
MASARRIELLLTANVENLGIVGDVVRVRMGFARNYLVPMGVAEVPTQEKMDALSEQREVALKAHEANRSEQASIIEKLEGITLTLTRSANDQGGLYGSVTQRDIADALIENGFSVDTRAVRLHTAIRRVGEYPVTIQFGTNMKVDVEVTINADRPLEDRDEMQFDDEGNLIIVEQSKTPDKTPDEANAEVPEATEEVAEETADA